MNVQMNYYFRKNYIIIKSKALILLAIALPSFRLLYLMDEVVLPGITVKVIGHQ
jgi:hypothetical protein